MKKYYILLSLACFLLNCKHNQNKPAATQSENIDSLFSSYRYQKLTSANKLVYNSKLLRALDSSNNDSLTRYYYFKLAGRYFNLEQYKKYLLVSKKNLKLAQSSNDTIDIAKSNQFVGDFFLNDFQNDSAYYYYSKAEKFYSISSKTNFLTDIKLAKAKILYYVKDFAGCETAVIDVLKSVIKKNDTRLIYECYVTIASAIAGLNNPEKAIEYYNKAYLLADQLQSDPQYLILKAQPYNYIGTVYLKNQQYSKSIPFFKKGLLLDNFKQSEPLLYANLISNLAFAQFKLGNKSAINQLSQALHIRDSLKNIPGVVSSKIDLAEYYLTQKDSSKALDFGKQARALARKNKMFEDELKTLQVLLHADPKQYRFYNARFIKLSDSLQTVERATRNKFARIEFETDEIITEKNIVETKNDQLVQQILWLLGISIAIILVIGLLYYTKQQHTKNIELRYEQAQQKANQEIYRLMLEQQANLDEGRKIEKKRISQELHDGIIGKLAFTKLNLSALKFNNDAQTIENCIGYIDNIQKIEDEIRIISHGLRNDTFKEKNSFKIIVEQLFESSCALANTKYKLNIDADINWDKVDNDIKMNLYRIFQESLQNINKYANAKNVIGIITKKDQNIRAAISDNGIGFDVNKTKDGIGLKNIKSRIKSLNGSVTIESEKNNGTDIILIIPY